MSERFMVDNCGTLIDKETRNSYDYVSDVVDLLNEQEETIQNKKGYILLLEQKLEEYGIRLEPKDFD